MIAMGAIAVERPPRASRGLTCNLPPTNLSVGFGELGTSFSQMTATARSLEANLLRARDRLGSSIVEAAADVALHGREVIEQLRQKNGSKLSEAWGKDLAAWSESPTSSAACQSRELLTVWERLQWLSLCNDRVSAFR
jgi:hypothetical protein